MKFNNLYERFEYISMLYNSRNGNGIYTNYPDSDVMKDYLDIPTELTKMPEEIPHTGDIWYQLLYRSEDMVVLKNIWSKGATMPTHLHILQHEELFILEGSLYDKNANKTLGPNEHYFIQANTKVDVEALEKTTFTIVFSQVEHFHEIAKN